jgi:hypothetical protein
MTIALCIVAYLIVGIVVVGLAKRIGVAIDDTEGRLFCVVLWPLLAAFLGIECVVWLMDAGVELIGGKKP